jgi:hypothetical protein
LALGLAGQFFVGQSASDNLAHGFGETLAIGHLAKVESKCLFIDVPKQVERFNAYVRAADGALQKAPEIF